MTLLLTDFDTLITTPDDVALLNQTILQLAVQGKLLPQDPHDEPARELLKRILPPQKDLLGLETPSESFIDEAEQPFELPTGWEWVRIRDITYNWGQKKPDKPFTYIDVSSIDNQAGKLGDTMQIIEPADAPSRARKIAKRGSIIYSTVRPYLLNIAIIDQDLIPPPIVSTAFYVMQPHDGLDVKFLYFYLRSKPFIEFVSSQMNGIAYPAISDSKFEQGIIPLPPLAEQARIVAKVEELFAQTRALAEKLAQSARSLSQLNQATLHYLLAAATPDELQGHWAFMATHFDTLFTHPDHVAPLRQAILELAVRGALTRREATDEPARELLRRIRAEKAAQGKVIKTLPPINDEEKPFELPVGWEWVRFEELGELERGRSRHRPRNAPFLYENGKYPFVQTGDVSQSKGRITAYSTMYSEEGLAQSRMWPKGTLCITIAANIAETGILEFDSCFPDSIVGFIPSVLIGEADYFQYFIKVAKERLESYAPATAQKNINLGILQKLLIPLPPTNEIKRIVAKVEALMGWCDELEAKLRQAQAARARLTAAVLAGV